MRNWLIGLLVHWTDEYLSESGCSGFLVPMLHRGFKDLQDRSRETQLVHLAPVALNPDKSGRGDMCYRNA